MKKRLMIHHPDHIHRYRHRHSMPTAPDGLYVSRQCYRQEEEVTRPETRPSNQMSESKKSS